MKPLKPVLDPHGSEAAKFKLGDVIAVQALYNGTADAEQQKIAMRWILDKACGLPNWAYRESERETALALGRQFVGQQIVGLTRLNISELKRRENV